MVVPPLKWTCTPKSLHFLFTLSLMSTKHKMDLLEFCLRSTYFTHKGKFFEQVEGAAMGSPISSIVANLFMENFESRALQFITKPPFIVEEVC